MRKPAVALTILTAAYLSFGARSNAEGLTFAKDIAPILQQHCQECHRPGEGAPMSFLSYQETRPWVKAIKKAIEDRTMPPWHADPSIGEWKNDRRLDDATIAKISSWVDAGAPMGDPADLPPARQWTDGWKIGEPDMVFQMAKEDVLGPDLVDEYRYIMVPTGLTEDRWVKAVEIRPSNLTVVHHVIAFIQTLGGGEQGFLGGYAPGLQPSVEPEGYGLLLPKGAILVLQMHYNKEKGVEARERTTIGVKFCDEPVIKQSRTGAIGNEDFVIPPNAENFPVDATFKAPVDVNVSWITPHMHLRGKSMKVWAKYPDGREEDLLFVPRWDFNWQTFYVPAKPLAIPAGTVLHARAIYDNSANNPHNPDPNSEVRFGLPTYAEMMFAFIGYSHDNENLNARDPGAVAGGAGR